MPLHLLQLDWFSFRLLANLYTDWKQQNPSLYKCVLGDLEKLFEKKQYKTKTVLRLQLKNLKMLSLFGLANAKKKKNHRQKWMTCHLLFTEEWKC